jgi:hypothetical protein
MPRNPVNVLKEEVADLQTTIDDTYDQIEELLDPSLSREEIVKGLQELSDDLSPDDEDDEDQTGE